MALWHCPFCGAPQATSARCWVCHRSSTTCSTCRHFRASLAADLGYCSKDRARAPLTGQELRACWEEDVRQSSEAPAAGAAGAPAGRPADPSDRPSVRSRGGPLDRPDPMRLRGFVPLDEMLPVAPPTAREAPSPLPPAILAEPPEGWEARTSLFGDADP